MSIDQWKVIIPIGGENWKVILPIGGVKWKVIIPNGGVRWYGIIPNGQACFYAHPGGPRQALLLPGTHFISVPGWYLKKCGHFYSD